MTKTESPIAPGTAALTLPTISLGVPAAAINKSSVMVSKLLTLTSAWVDVPENSLKHRFIAAVMALSRPSRTWPIDAGI